MSLFKRLYALAGKILQNKDRIRTLINKAQEKSGEFRSVLGNVALLIRFLKAHRNGTYKAPTKVIVRVVMGLLYFLLATDLMPDFIPGFGMVDDAAVLTWVVKSIKDELDRFTDFERTQNEKNHHTDSYA